MVIKKNKRLKDKWGGIRNVFLLEQMRSFFIYIIIHDPDKTLFIVNDEFFYLYKDIVFNLKNICIIKKPFGFDIKKPLIFNKKKLIEKISLKYLKFKFLKVFNKNRLYVKKIIKILKDLEINKYENVYGVRHLPIAVYYFYNIMRENNYILVEDGTSDYNQLIKKKLDPYKYKKIYLTNNIKNIEGITNIENINIKKYWEEKSDYNKNKILKILNVNNNKLRLLKNKEYILYTQPLSEDNIITELEKIEIYRKVISNYKKETLIIKKHPREKTDYTKIFKNIEVLDGYFPSEFIKLLNIDKRIKKHITLFSTAVFIEEDKSKIDFYGTEVNDKIYKYYGSMDEIFERNKFL